MVDLSLDKIKYGGQYHYYFWDSKFNPVATIEDCLPNCTTFVIGDCGATGSPRPVSKVVGAARWHEVLANDWVAIPFDPTKIKVGDILEWTAVPHVGRVFKIENGVPWIRGSFYTGENGVSTLSDGSYDTRKRFNTLQEVWEFMSKNYPSRCYHEWPLDKMNTKVGAQPAYILSMPNTIPSVERDESVDQIRTTDTSLRIRTGPSLNSSIVGYVETGYYNVISVENASYEDKKWYKENRNDDLNCWYQIAQNRWCGNPTTEFLAKKADTDIAKAMQTIIDAVGNLTEERDRYKEGIKSIADIANKLI